MNVKNQNKNQRKNNKPKNKSRQQPKQLLLPKQVVDYVNSHNPTKYRALGPSKTVPALQQYNKYMKAQYLYGLAHPDLAVKEGRQVKLYSDIPLPTASIGYHVQQQLTTSTFGNFLLSWRPAVFMTQEVLTSNALNAFSGVTYNNSAALSGNAGVAGNAFIAANYYPNIALQRYRLVSALMKVSYNGSRLAQAGTLLSCCTFDPLVVGTGTTAVSITNQADPLVDRFGNFSLIANGLWNTTVNITTNGEGLECLFVPLDPDDYMFQRNGTFYGTNITAASSTTYSPDAEGAHINYVVAGRNLPSSTACLLIDFYYNYEVIADPSSAPIVRASMDTALDDKHHKLQVDTINAIAKSKGFIRETSPVAPSSFGSTMEKILSMGVKYLPMILGAL